MGPIISSVMNNSAIITAGHVFEKYRIQDDQRWINYRCKNCNLYVGFIVKNASDASFEQYIINHIYNNMWHNDRSLFEENISSVNYIYTCSYFKMLQVLA